MARKTVKEVSEDLDKLVERYDKAVRCVSALELKLALLHQRTETIEKDLSGIFGSFSWAWRAVGGLFIAGVVGFIISGGLIK